MNNYYTPWYKTVRDIGRRSIDGRYHSSEKTGTNFAGKPCVRSSRWATLRNLISVREKERYKMNLYEFNKNLYKSVPAMSASNVQTVIKEYLEKYPSSFYLMLNHDKHYYTVFHVEDIDHMITNKSVHTIWSIVRELGEVVDAMIGDNGMLEFWIRQDPETILMFGFFNYERGVVKL